MNGTIPASTLSMVERLTDRLSRQGYEVHTDDGENTVTGKSGAPHSFDIVATRNDGFMEFTVAIDVAVAGADDSSQKLGLGAVFAFDDKCYDSGIRDKVFVALPGLDETAERFAQNQRIRVFDEVSLPEFLDTPTPELPEATSVTTWENRKEVLESLAALGYRIQRNAHTTGRSGAEYVFDALATVDDGLTHHRIGIDEIDDEAITLGRVSVFDAKAYDAGILDKLLMVSSDLTPEAEKFAELQKIRVIVVTKSDEDTTSASTLDESTESTIRSAEERLPAEQPARGRVVKSRPEPAALNLIPEAMARRFKVVPLKIEDDTLHVAMANPSDIFALEALGMQSRKRIEPVTASEREVRDAIDMSYRGFGDIQEQLSRIPTYSDSMDEQSLIEAAEDTPVASALRLILEEAAKARASDVHMEPEEDRLRVRYRVDGTLQEVMSLPSKIHLPLTSRVKILADMNIADHLRPQDGQFSTETKGRNIDVRVATVPTVHGEATVMRLLDQSLGLMDLQELGFSEEALAQYQNMLKVAFGMILVSGPTGSGKTTTLYASINQMDRDTQKIITIEDPVEYRFDGISQIQINPKAGLTFAGGLRSILRLDPDTILVGEIRDGETSRIAVQSALTGHLVLSSIHANDAIGVVFRMLDLGIEPFLVSSSVIGVVAQRMVRRICTECAIEREGTLMEQLAYHNATGEHKAKFLYGEGCELCGHSGYKGRLGMYEVLPLSDAIRMMILKGASTSEVRQKAEEEGMIPLMRDGMMKVKKGITTPAEVLRNAYFIE